MKKSFFAVFAIMLFAGVSAYAGSGDDPAKQKIAASTVSTDPHIISLVNRYNEIENMDKSGLSSSEKKQLRKESSDIKDELKAQDGVVIYLSGAAILIIILLIILL